MFKKQLKNLGISSSFLPLQMENMPKRFKLSKEIQKINKKNPRTNLKPTDKVIECEGAKGLRIIARKNGKNQMGWDWEKPPTPLKLEFVFLVKNQHTKFSFFLFTLPFYQVVNPRRVKSVQGGFGRVREIDQISIR